MTDVPKWVKDIYNHFQNGRNGSFLGPKSTLELFS